MRLSSQINENNRKENVYITQYWKELSCGRKQLLCCFCGIQYGDCIGVRKEVLNMRNLTWIV